MAAMTSSENHQFYYFIIIYYFMNVKNSLYFVCCELHMYNKQFEN